MTQFLGSSRTTLNIGSDTLLPAGGYLTQAQCVLGESMINIGTPQMRAVVPEVPRVTGVAGNLHVVTSASIVKSNGTDETTQTWQYNDQVRDNQPVGWVNRGQSGYGPPFTDEETAYAETLLGSPTAGDFIQGTPSGDYSLGGYPPTLAGKSSGYFFDWAPFVGDSHTSVAGTLVVTVTLNASENFTNQHTTYVTDFGAITPPISADDFNGFDVGQRFSSPTRYITPFLIFVEGDAIDPTKPVYINATVAVSYTYGYGAPEYVDDPKSYLCAQRYDRSGNVPVLTAVSGLLPYAIYNGVADSTQLDQRTVAFLVRVYDGQTNAEGLDVVLVTDVDGVLVITVYPVLRLTYDSGSYGAPSYTRAQEGAYTNLLSYASFALVSPDVLVVTIGVQEQSPVDYSSIYYLARARFSYDSSGVNPLDAGYSRVFSSTVVFTTYGSVLGADGREWTLLADYNGHYELVSYAGVIPVATVSNYGYSRFVATASGFAVTILDYSYGQVLRSFLVTMAGAVVSAVTSPVSSDAAGIGYSGGHEQPWASHAIAAGQQPWGAIGYDPVGQRSALYFGSVDPTTGDISPNSPIVTDLGLSSSYFGGGNDPTFVITPSGLGYSSIDHYVPSGYEVLFVLVQFGPTSTVVPYLRLLQRDDGNGIARHARLALSSGSPNQPSSEQASRSPRLRQLPGSYL